MRGIMDAERIVQRLAETRGERFVHPFRIAYAIMRKR